MNPGHCPVDDDRFGEQRGLRRRDVSVGSGTRFASLLAVGWPTVHGFGVVFAVR